MSKDHLNPPTNVIVGVPKWRYDRLVHTENLVQLALDQHDLWLTLLGGPGEADALAAFQETLALLRNHSVADINRAAAMTV